MNTLFAAAYDRNDGVLGSQESGRARFTISGRLIFRKPCRVPDSVRLIVLWSITSASLSNGVVYGEGTLDMANSMFAISFDRHLLPVGRNIFPDGVSGFGVGHIILTTDGSLRQGEICVDSRRLHRSFFGAVNKTCLVYVEGNPTSFQENHCGAQWLRHFKNGYNVGFESHSGYVPEGIVPIGEEGLELEVDTDIRAFDFPTWSSSPSISADIRASDSRIALPSDIVPVFLSYDSSAAPNRNIVHVDSRNGAHGSLL